MSFIKELAKEVAAAHLASSEQNMDGVRTERLIAWKPPNEGWMKLNTDGASHGTAGGVLRHSVGNWCGGFAVNLEICLAPLAELWGCVLWFIHCVGASSYEGGIRGGLTYSCWLPHDRDK